MRGFAGPWYVLEHVRLFPGVTCERLVRQIRRGVLARMTIVRGPSTDHQWRFAGETPGLCKYLVVCWSCQARATIQQSRCPACGVDLGELTDETGCGEPASPVGGAVLAEGAEIRRLRDAVRTVPRPATLEQDAPRIGIIRTSWIVVAIVVVLVGILVVVASLRGAGIREQSQPHPVSVTE